MVAELTRSAMLWGSVACPLLARTRCRGGATAGGGGGAGIDPALGISRKKWNEFLN